MKETFVAKLWVNGTPVELNPFVEEFLSRTVTGAVRPLRGGKDIKDLELDVDRGDVKVIVNGTELTVTPFPNDVIANTFTGLVSTLKGVDKVDNFRVEVKVL